MSGYGQYLFQWLDGRPKRTAEEYRRDIVQAFDWFQKHLNSLTLEDCQNYRAHLVDTRKLKPRTVNRKLTALSAFLKFCVEQGGCDRNPAEKLRAPKVTNDLAGKLLTPEQVKALLHAAPAGRARLLLQLTYVIGARVSEVIRLEWSDFTEQPGGGIQVSLLGKGQKQRSVLVPDAMWADLQQLQILGPESKNIDTPRVFGKLTRFDAHRIIKAAASTAGLPSWVSMHKLRHAHASHSLAGGAPLHLVRDTLGHHNVSVTNIYLQANPRDSSSNYLDL